MVRNAQHEAAAEPAFGLRKCRSSGRAAAMGAGARREARGDGGGGHAGEDATRADGALGGGEGARGGHRGGLELLVPLRRRRLLPLQ